MNLWTRQHYWWLRNSMAHSRWTVRVSFILWILCGIVESVNNVERLVSFLLFWHFSDMCEGIDCNYRCCGEANLMFPNELGFKPSQHTQDDYWCYLKHQTAAKVKGLRGNEWIRDRARDRAIDTLRDRARDRAIDTLRDRTRDRHGQTERDDYLLTVCSYPLYSFLDFVIGYRVLLLCVCVKVSGHRAMKLCMWLSVTLVHSTTL